MKYNTVTPKKVSNDSNLFGCNPNLFYLKDTL